MADYPDNLAPTWELEIGGVRLLEDYRRLVTGIRCEATVDGADEIVIDAVAWDERSSSFRILGETIFAAGNEAVFFVGYAGSTRALQRFRLVREEARYGSDGPPTVTIRGYSTAHRLVESTRARSWPAGTADSDIALELAAEFGISVAGSKVQATEPRTKARVKKAGDTDLAFLQQLAVANGYGEPIIRYDPDLGEDVLYFRSVSLADQAEMATFYWNPAVGGSEAPTGTCLSFAPTLSLAGVPTKIEVLGFDPVAQQPIKVVLEITEQGQESTVYRGGDVGTTAAPRSGSQLQVRVLAEGGKDQEKREVLSVAHIQTTEDAVSWGTRWLRTRNQAFMVARATVVGYENLWVGQIHEFRGLAEPHNGKWEVLQCTHKFGDQGYVCDLDLARVLEQAAAPTESS